MTEILLPTDDSASVVSREVPPLSAAEYGRKAKIGFLWLSSTTAAWQIISWTFTLITARLLLPSDYGILAMTDAVVPYLVMITTFKLDAWSVQREKVDRRTEGVALTLLLMLGALSSAAALAAAPFLAHFYDEPRLTRAFQAVSIVFILRALQVLPDSRMRRELLFKPAALMNLSLAVARSVLTLALAYFGYGYWSLLCGMVFGEAARAACLIRMAGIPWRLAWDKDIVRDAITFGAAGTASTLLWVVFSTADNVVVGRLFGTELLGYYAMAFYLTDLPLSKINSVIVPILIPYFSKLRNDPEAFASTYLKINRMVVSAVAPILCGLLVVAPEALPIVLGDQWSPAATALRVLCLVGLLRAMTATTSPLLLAKNKPKRLLAWTAVNALLLPPAFYLLGGRLGLTGIYLAWLCIYPLTGVLLMTKIIDMTLGISMRRFVVNLRPPLVSAAVMVLLCWSLEVLIPLKPVSLLIMQVLAGAAAYMGTFLIVFKSDFEQLKATLMSVKD